MLHFLSALASAFLLQAPSPPAVDVEAVTTEVAAFATAMGAREYEKAEAKVAPLVAKFAELGRAAAEPVKEGSPRDLPESCRKARKQISECLGRAVREARAPARLQQKVLATFGLQPDEGEKLDVAALGVEHIIEVPESAAAAIRALGSFRKPKYIETFEKQLGDQRADVLNAAADALGEYFGEKEEVRKQIVGKLISVYEGAGMGPAPVGSGGPRRTMTDHEIVMKIRREFQIALSRLTGGVHFDRAAQWSDWYRDAKSKKWRDGVDKVSIKFDGLESSPSPGKH